MSVNASRLENLSEPDAPAELADITVSWQTAPVKRRQSRASRRDDALCGLNAVVEKLDEIAEDETRSEDDREAATSLRDEVQSLIDDAEAVELPGMYG